MTDNDSSCAKWVLLGAGIGAAIIGSCSYASGVGTGYALWASNESNEMACAVELAPKKKEFREACIGKQYDAVDKKTLDKIIAERDVILQQNDCVRQEWLALPEEPDNYASMCKVQFEYK